MYIYVNEADNSICSLSQDDVGLDIIQGVIKVEIPDNSFQNCEAGYEHYMVYDPESSTIYRDDTVIAFECESGKQRLVEELQRIALLPVEVRNEDDFSWVQMAQRFVGQEKVNEVLSDNVLTDDEIEDILEYLNAD